ncbi:hypothetical protein [Streptomyces sp. PT12]|uniref:hypothetical protein n=1 Tax=Streptomyces sp. PT12 TaxID=1510197 RepID=UPI000DE2B862|nr:hypothetical protein [Streptomyces sp. PT12]RBM06845.1 hypothetical protein DEH69_25605 [Streptomyces sp. PT12]
MSPEHAGLITGTVFAVSALAAIASQARLTTWAQRRIPGPPAITVGLFVMGAAFLPLLPSPPETTVGVAALAACAALLALGGALLYPFEMDTLVRFAGPDLVATYYGAYQTVCDVAVSLGNLAVGALFDVSAASGAAWLPWAALASIGALCAGAMTLFDRSGRLIAA